MTVNEGQEGVECPSAQLNRAPIGNEFAAMAVEPVPAEFEKSGRVGHPIHDREYTEALQVFSECFSRTQGLGVRVHVRFEPTVKATRKGATGRWRHAAQIV